MSDETGISVRPKSEWVADLAGIRTRFRLAATLVRFTLSGDRVHTVNFVVFRHLLQLRTFHGAIRCDPTGIYLQFKSSIKWALSNPVALLRWNLFTYRDLWTWINRPADHSPPCDAHEQLCFVLDSSDD